MTSHFHPASRTEARLAKKARPARQCGALCYRRAGEDVEVLLITSSEGRWILPKGWPMAGKTPSEAAMIEAWEEAGLLKGRAEPRPMGTFTSLKQDSDGDDYDCCVEVFEIETFETTKTYPEAGQRHRKWVRPEAAAQMVSNEELGEMLKEWQGPKGG